MKSHYGDVSGGEAMTDTVKIAGFPPVNVMRFDFFRVAQTILNDPDLMKGSLWKYDPKTNEDGERVYGEMNTGDVWKQGEEYLERRIEDMVDEGLNEQNDGTHFLVPVLLFIDNTLTDLLGRLPCEPCLFSFGNILEKLRRSPHAWRLLGMVPAYPKSSQERAAEAKSQETKSLQMEYYHACLTSLLRSRPA
jgi:hypothetical protein